ncbi:hypothetical protein M9H77_36187 [Catharanthus roseus]|uniref:Uncharacterized protein n=1 Tax=Catharanthus roseus TaxID=4058 RepID=A0ACB9ZR33_CATRO|nr:hypothetical protein M9H77_36187 [Catharanthus roseus]
MAYYKLARARSNCYKDGDYGGNSYEGSHHRDAHFTHRSQMGIGNFCSCVKTFDQIPYDDYGANEGINDTYDYYEDSPYDVYKGITLKSLEIHQVHKEQKKLKERLRIFENEKNIEWEENMEIKEKERVEKEERIFNPLSCEIPRVINCHSNVANNVPLVLGIKDKGRRMKKELTNFYGNK